MKSANWTTNVALLLLVIALSILTYKTSEQKDIDNTLSALTSLAPEKTSTIKINKNDRYTVIKKQNNIWHITQPIKVKANQFRIGSILKLLTTNNYTRYAIDDLDLKQYGLLDSRLSMQVDNIDILFGTTNPVNAKRYILINNSMYLIEDNIFPLINSQLGTLVDHRLLSEEDKIIKIQTTGFTLSKDKNNLWKSTSPTLSDDVVKTVNHWKNAQAFGVHDYALRKTLDTIKITLRDNKTPVDFLVTDKEPWLIIARPDLNLEYHFDKENIAKLLSTEHDDIATENGQ